MRVQLEQLVRQGHREHKVMLAQLDQQDPLALPDQKEQRLQFLDRQDLQVPRVRLVLRALQVRRVLLDQKERLLLCQVRLAPLVRRDQRVPRLRFLDRLVRQDQLVMWVQLDRQDQQGQLVRQVHKEFRVMSARQDQRVQ